MLTKVFTPDASPETSSVDGFVGVNDVSLSWAAIKAAAGNYAGDAGPSITVYIQGVQSSEPLYAKIIRGITVFDTSTLAGLNIKSATLKVWGSTKLNQLGAPALGVYPVTTLSNTALVAADYDTCGSIVYAPSISYAAFDAAGWNTFSLSSTALLDIAAGTLKVCFREANYDVSGTEPTFASAAISGFIFDSADALNDHPPTLTVKYKVPMIAGNIAIVGTCLHYIDTLQAEYYLQGELVAATSMTQGNLGVVENRLHYVGYDGNEYHLLGELAGASSMILGNLAIVKTTLHYLGTDGNEYYLQGELAS